MNHDESTTILTAVVKAQGHASINPESLAAIREKDWHALSVGTPYSAPDVRVAHNTFTRALPELPQPGMRFEFVVRTQDVDCRTVKRYRTRKAALARFDEMHGSMDNAIAERWDGAANAPTRDTVTAIRGVSDHGCTVSFERYEVWA